MISSYEKINIFIKSSVELPPDAHAAFDWGDNLAIVITMVVHEKYPRAINYQRNISNKKLWEGYLLVKQG